MKECLVCKVEFEAKRDSAKFCSPKCRVTHSRNVTLTSDSVTLSDPVVTLRPPVFKFKIVQSEDPKKYMDSKDVFREAIYWYDVPLAAIPIYEQGWPKMPNYMNGRQYFLWWKNNFEEGEHGAIIHNPFPARDSVTYVSAGDGSRRWGAA